MNNTSTPVLQNKFVAAKVSKTPLTPCRRVGLGRPSSSLKKVTEQANNITPKNVELEKLKTPINVKRTDEHCSRSNIDRLKVPSTNSVELNTSLPIKNLSSSRTRRLKAKRILGDSDLNGYPSLDDFQSYSLLTIETEDTSKNKIAHPQQKNNAKKQKTSYDNLRSESSQTVVHSSLDFDTGNNDLKPAPDSKNITTEMIRKLVSSIIEKKNRLELSEVQQTYSKKHNLEDLKAQTSKWRKAGQDALRYSVSLAEKAGFQVTIKQLIDDHGFSTDVLQYNEDDDDFL